MLDLPLLPAEATPISGPYSWAVLDGVAYYFSNLRPFDSHPVEDARARYLVVARLHLKAGVRIVDLVRAFGLSRSTAHRVIDRMREGGEAALLLPTRRPGAGRRRTVVTPEKARRAESLLAGGMSQRACARELDLSASTFSVNLRAGVIRRPEKARPRTEGRAERAERDWKPARGRACHDSERRSLAAAGLLEEASPRFEEARAVASGGVLAALPALLREGLLETARRRLRLPKGFYGLSSILLLSAFLTLSRARSAEALRHADPGEWGRLLGLDRAPEVKTFRKKIALLADSARTARDWQRELARHWLKEEREEPGLTLAVDGHVKVYTGRKGKLPKHFVSRQKLCLPAAASYWIHLTGGAPLLRLHQALDPKMAHALEHEIAPELERIGVLPPDAPDLTRGGTPAATLAFDREGWSPALFRRLARRGVAVITWRKGARGDDWPTAEFRPQAVPRYGPTGRAGTSTLLLAERRVSLKEGPPAREIRRLLDGGRQAALVTTHPDLPLAEVAGILFSRWSQENFFKYMRQEFQLDALPEHALEPLDPETPVVNPERREVQKAIGRLSTRILREVRKGKTPPALQAEREAEREALRRERARLPTHVRAGDLPEEQRLDALPQARRLFLDLVRMLCYRAETRMMAPMAMAKGKNPRKTLAALLRADAHLLPDPARGILQVELLGFASAAAERAVRPLLQELNRTRTLYPGTRLRLVYRIASAE